MDLNLAEVLENYSQVVGTLCIKYLTDFESDESELQIKLRQLTNTVLLHINEVTSNESFNSLLISIIPQKNEESFGAYISLLDRNKDLVIQYSTDSSLINVISSDQDQVSYDLGILTFKSEPINALPNLKIVTLITPISVRI